MSEFRCAVCRHLYVKGLPDPDPESFDREAMPGFTAQECHLVCDDCWCGIVARIEASETIAAATERLLRARAQNAYFDPACPVRACDQCGRHYTGPSVYCGLACAVAAA